MVVDGRPKVQATETGEQDGGVGLNDERWQRRPDEREPKADVPRRMNVLPTPERGRSPPEGVVNSGNKKNREAGGRRTDVSGPATDDDQYASCVLHGIVT